MAQRAFARLRALRRDSPPNGSSASHLAHRADSSPRRARTPHTISRAPARPGIARAGTEAPGALVRLRRFLDLWSGQRALCMELVSMVWPAHGSPEAGLGSGLRFVVDDSRFVCCRRVADGKSSTGRRAGLDAPGELTGTSVEKGKV